MNSKARPYCHIAITGEVPFELELISKYICLKLFVFWTMVSQILGEKKYNKLNIRSQPHEIVKLKIVKIE